MSSTLGDRRLLRLEQRDVNDALLSNRDRLGDVGGAGLLASLRARNDALFQRVDHAREQLNDVLNLREIAWSSKQQSERLNESAFGYDYDSLSIVLQRKYIAREDSTGRFSWDKLGKDASALFCSAPKLSALRGSLMKPERLRAAPSRRAPKEHADVVRPLEIQHGPGSKAGDGAAQAESTNERVNSLFSHFHRQSKEARVDLMSLLLDPVDAVQTVENFFDFGFLVKTKRVAMESVGGRLLCTETNPDAIVNHHSTQIILALDMKDLRSITEDQLLQRDSCPLHRDDPLYAAKTALEQAAIIEERDAAERAGTEPGVAGAAVGSSGKKRPHAETSRDSQPIQGRGTVNKRAKT